MKDENGILWHFGLLAGIKLIKIQNENDFEFNQKSENTVNLKFEFYKKMCFFESSKLK